MSPDNRVNVTMEWALWGQTTTRPGYRVLDCSSGVTRRERFDEIVTRYSPGTLENLPQVTIGWSRERRPDGDQVALAIHEQLALSDAEGDHSVLARLFCAPFRQLAAGLVGYLPMYEELRPLGVQRLDHEPLSMRFPAGSVAGLADSADLLAMRSAALLLAARPVCILGADRVGLDERLRFIDTVASLLPYGLRARLSAATWVSSTFYRHKFRLFFAAAERHGQDRDQVVVWDGVNDQDIADPPASRYFALLSDGLISVRKLAEFTEPMDFSGPSIEQILYSVDDQRAFVAGTVPVPDSEPDAAVVSGDDSEVGGILLACAEAFSGDTSKISGYVEKLRTHLSDPVTSARRRGYLRRIAEYRLFRPDPPISGRQLSQFYDVLLQLVFDRPIRYRDYCRLERCVGVSPGQPMSTPLLQAMLEFGLDGAAELLVLIAASEEQLQSHLGDGSADLTSLVAATVDSRLLPQHAMIMCEIISRHLNLSLTDRAVLRKALGDVGYLAPLLQRIYPDQPQTQLDLLSGILQAANGRKLPRGEVHKMFSAVSTTPTLALLAAALPLMGPRDVPMAVGQFTAAAVAVRPFSEETKQQIKVLLSRHCA
jgi:hypothetical protein